MFLKRNLVRCLKCWIRTYLPKNLRKMNMVVSSTYEGSAVLRWSSSKITLSRRSLQNGHPKSGKKSFFNSTMLKGCICRTADILANSNFQDNTSSRCLEMLPWRFACKKRSNWRNWLYQWLFSISDENVRQPTPISRLSASVNVLDWWNHCRISAVDNFILDCMVDDGPTKELENSSAFTCKVLPSGPDFGSPPPYNRSPLTYWVRDFVLTSG